MEPLQGEKLLDYFYFVKVVELMKNKSHLTPQHLQCWGPRGRRRVKSNMWDKS
jgi:hypothetical protein